MELKKINKTHAKSISILIKKTFDEFIAHTFTKSASADFLNDLTEQNIITHLKDLNGYVAIIDSNVVGVIMISNKRKKITTLFVDKKQQHKGIATALVNKIIADLKSQNATSIRSWSSLYAVAFYQAQGFKKTRGVVKNKKGYTYQPMKKMI